MPVGPRLQHAVRLLQMSSSCVRRAQRFAMARPLDPEAGLKAPGCAALGRQAQYAEGRSVAEAALQQWACDVVDGHTVDGLALQRAPMGMAVHHEVDGVAQQRVFKPAAAQEGVDLGRLPLHGRGNGRVVQHRNAVSRTQLGQRGLELQGLVQGFIDEGLDSRSAPCAQRCAAETSGKALLAQMGGDITVSSVPGLGSTFTVGLALAGAA